MPPRKRHRGGSAESPAPTARALRSAERPYRTRHRVVLRDTETARREGSVGDLVPPSDDEEYEPWRHAASRSMTPSPMPPGPEPQEYKILFGDYASSSSIGSDGDGDGDGDGDDSDQVNKQQPPMDLEPASPPLPNPHIPDTQLPTAPPIRRFAPPILGEAGSDTAPSAGTPEPIATAGASFSRPKTVQELDEQVQGTPLEAQPPTEPEAKPTAPVKQDDTSAATTTPAKPQAQTSPLFSPTPTRLVISSRPFPASPVDLIHGRTSSSLPPPSPDIECTRSQPAELSQRVSSSPPSQSQPRSQASQPPSPPNLRNVSLSQAPSLPSTGQPPPSLPPQSQPAASQPPASQSAANRPDTSQPAAIPTSPPRTNPTSKESVITQLDDPPADRQSQPAGQPIQQPTAPSLQTNPADESAAEPPFGEPSLPEQPQVTGTDHHGSSRREEPLVPPASEDIVVRDEEARPVYEELPLPGAFQVDVVLSQDEPINPGHELQPESGDAPVDLAFPVAEHGTAEGESHLPLSALPVDEEPSRESQVTSQVVVEEGPPIEEESQLPIGASPVPIDEGHSATQQELQCVPASQHAVDEPERPAVEEEESQLPLGASQADSDIPDLGGYDMSDPGSPMEVDSPRRPQSRLFVEIPATRPRLVAREESPDPIDALRQLSPDSPRAPAQLLSQRAESQRTTGSIQQPPPSPPATGPSEPSLPPAPAPPPPPPADPALLRFRFSRTFRNRTALQLQPYTREKQLYEKALQRGGLAKGKRAIAPAAVVAANKDTDTSDSADQSDADDEDATPPDAIVIGATQEPRKKRKPKALIDADYDEYYIRFGTAAVDEEDEEVSARLQVIARERLKTEKEIRRAARAAEKTRRDYEAFMGLGKEDARKDKEKDKEERERKRAEAKAEKEKRQQLREKERAERAKIVKEKEERRREREAARTNSGKVSSKTNRTPNTTGRPKVYGKRRQPQSKTQSKPAETYFDFDGSSDLSEPPPLSDEDGAGLAASRPQGSPTSLRSASPFLPAVDHFDDPGDDFPTASVDRETRETESIPIAPRTQKRRRLLSSSPSDGASGRRQRLRETSPRAGRAPPSESESSQESDDPQQLDKRERIARRMLPGVMLKRLAAAEKSKQLRRAQQAAERRRASAVSPLRPGQAVRRRGGAGGMEGMDDLWDSESSDERREKRPRNLNAAWREDRGSSHHRTPRRTPRRHRPDPDTDDDLRLEPDDIDLSFSVHGSPVAPDVLGSFAHPIALDLDASDSQSVASRDPSPTPGAIVISSGSEAEEDNDETLAHLHRGDFDAILQGKSTAAALRLLDHKHQADREKRRKRKPRPILRRIQFHSPRRDGKMVQSMLHLPPLEKGTSVWETGAVPEAGPLGVAKRTGGQRRITDWDDRNARKEDRLNKNRKDRDSRQSRKNKTNIRLRPAIRLDDQTIFATEEFAFDSEPENHPPPAADKRVFTRVTSRTDRRSPVAVSPRTPTTPRVPLRDPGARQATPRARLDDGVGKARSWANFDRFPIDFDITPLPSDVYLSSTIATELAPFLAALDGTIEELKPLHAFGVHFHATMDLEESLGVLPIVLDGVYGAIRAYIDDPHRGENDAASLEGSLAALHFFRDLLLRSNLETKEALYAPFEAFGDKLSDISLSSRSADRAAVGQLLRVRYILLQIAVVASPAHVPNVSSQLFILLLTYGFDRTLKPIRRVLRGEVDTTEISDDSVALWVAVGYLLARCGEDIFATSLLDAIETRYAGEIGPLAAERVWFLVFGLCALNQFEPSGAVAQEYRPHPRWGLVKRAVGLIKVAHSQEAEEAAQLGQLQGRDRYIKTMVARCLRLSSAWAWSFDKNSFSIATRDLGMIFKDRQHRNLPTEPPADFPMFLSEFDISLSATDSPESMRRASAFELYLRLASVAASDVIASAEELSEAHKAERDVQRLIMSIFPLSGVPFSRASPPTARQLSALVNRYSTMVVASYFSPSLLPWLLSNSSKWIDFKAAGFESRQVVIRGLMYLAVAVRHHSAPLEPVVARLAEILAILQSELEVTVRGREGRLHPTKVEIERTMVLVVTAFRQIILHSSYTQGDDVYPDPVLLHESWLARVFELDLAKDVKSGLEIVSTIQAYLDARSRALPRRAAAARKSAHDSLDDYPSLGFDFDAIDLAALGGDEAEVDPIETADAQFAAIVRDTICPKIYRLLSDMLPPILEKEPEDQVQARTDRQVLVAKLTQCWSDCAAVVVVEHRLMDWSSYVGPFGQQSWSRLGNEAGRVQVGLHFMLNVAQVDPSAFRTQEEEFLALLFQALVADRLTIQHKYVAALFGLPGALDHALLAGVGDVLKEIFPDGSEIEFTRTTFLQHRPRLLAALFANISPLLRGRHTPAEMKSLVYRCINIVVATMASNERQIDERRVLHRDSYRVFINETIGDLRKVAGEYVTPTGVPALKSLTWVKN